MVTYVTPSTPSYLIPLTHEELVDLAIKHADGVDVLADDDNFTRLFDYFCNNGEMPYGTAKARTGDPYQWLGNRLDQEAKLK